MPGGVAARILAEDDCLRGAGRRLAAGGVCLTHGGRTCRTLRLNGFSAHGGRAGRCHRTPSTSGGHRSGATRSSSAEMARRLSAWTQYRLWLQNLPGGRQLATAAIFQLRGKDLACWCPLDQPCHADCGGRRGCPLDGPGGNRCTARVLAIARQPRPRRRASGSRPNDRRRRRPAPLHRARDWSCTVRGAALLRSVSGARRSVGERLGLLSRGSQVRILPGAPYLPRKVVAPLRAIKSFVPGITRDNSGIPGMPTRVGATTSGRPLWVAQPEPSSAAVGGCP